MSSGMGTSARTIAYFRADPENVKKQLESVWEGGSAKVSQSTQYGENQQLMT